MTEASVLSARGWRAAAWLWLGAVLLMLGHLCWLGLVERPRPDSDVMALLPRDARDPVAELAFSRMAASSERRVVVLLGAATTVQAQQAADAYIAGLGAVRATVRHRVGGGDVAAWRSFLAPFRGGLIGAEGRATLALPPAEQARHALARLFSPASGGGLAWRDDPLGLFTGWMLEQAAGQNVRAVDGRLWIHADGREWAVVLLELSDGAFSLDTQQALMPHLDAAAARARQAVPAVSVLRAGVAPVAAAVASEAQTELSTIGIGSTVGVILIVLLVFRRPGALLLSLLPLLVGTLCAMSATWLVFERMHVMTLVFGASLIGVGVDYGVHFLCAGIGEAPFDPARRRDMLTQGLWLAMVTTVVAYIALALAPFPGLRQMAVFSGAGLIASWLTVMLWFPLLQRRPTHGTALGAWMGRMRARWPAFRWGWQGALAAAVFLLVTGFGFSRLQIHDDVRLLQAIPPAMLAEQAKVGQLAGVPSPAQFFVVRGKSPEAVLQREEALAQRLAPLLADGTLGGIESAAHHLPSMARQRSDCARLRALYADPAWREPIVAATGIDGAAIGRLGECAPLDFARWFAQPASEPFRGLWLGRVDDDYAGVVMLQGLHGAAAAGRVAMAADNIEGVSWTDKPARISAVLREYRGLMSWVIAAGYLASIWLLWRRFGRETWRAMLPTFAASALAIAALGIAGLPFQLFAVLGLFIVLGMGIDYGIFLLEHPRRDDGNPWLAVTISALSTLLSFGLLALSSTPALRVFGLSCLVGVGSAWLLAPCFAKRDAE